jgi:hypothetical protein
MLIDIEKEEVYFLDLVSLTKLPYIVLNNSGHINPTRAPVNMATLIILRNSTASTNSSSSVLGLMWISIDMRYINIIPQTNAPIVAPNNALNIVITHTSHVDISWDSPSSSLSLCSLSVSLDRGKPGIRIKICDQKRGTNQLFLIELNLSTI